MDGPVPPQIEAPKSFIGVGARELVILCVAVLLAVVIFTLPFHLVARVVLAVIDVGVGLAMAFGRDRRSGKALEAVLLDRIRFFSRVRFQQKGTDTAQVPAPRIRFPVSPEKTSDRPSSGRDPAIEPGYGLLKVKPLPLGGGLMLSILSLAFMAGLLAWLWMGGVVEVQAWLVGPGF
jgi:hypothetical protein